MRLSYDFIFIVPAQAIQPNLLRAVGRIFLSEGRNGTSFRVDTNQQTVVAGTFKYDLVVSFRSGQDRCTLQFFIITACHIRETVSTDEQFLFYGLRLGSLYLRRKSPKCLIDDRIGQILLESEGLCPPYRLVHTTYQRHIERIAKRVYLTDIVRNKTES